MIEREKHTKRKTQSERIAEPNPFTMSANIMDKDEHIDIDTDLYLDTGK